MPGMSRETKFRKDVEKYTDVIFINIDRGISGLQIREYGRRDPSRWPHGTL
jgi:hypothetical protein